MPRNVSIHKLKHLSNTETPNEILLDTNPQTELHITIYGGKTIIKFPFGNKAEIVDGCLIVHSKRQKNR